MAFWTDEIKEINTQHSCAFLTGVLAKKMDPQVFSTYLPTVVPKLLNIINNKDCWSEERAEFTDNAIGALGKICKICYINNFRPIPIIYEQPRICPSYEPILKLNATSP